MTLNYIVNIDVGNDVYEEKHVHVECNSFDEGIEKIKKSYEDYDIANIVKLYPEATTDGESW